MAQNISQLKVHIVMKPIFGIVKYSLYSEPKYNLAEPVY